MIWLFYLLRNLENNRLCKSITFSSKCTNGYHPCNQIAIRWGLLLFIGGWLNLNNNLQAQGITDNLFKQDNTLSRDRAGVSTNKQTVLFLEEDVLQNLINNEPHEWSLNIPYEREEGLNLVLKRRELYSDAIKVSNSEDEQNIAILNLHYTGFVEDYPNSKVALSLSEQEVSGLIQLEEKTILLQKTSNDSADTHNHVVYNYADYPPSSLLDCAFTDTIPNNYESNKRNRTSSRSSDEGLLCVSVRVEVDKDFRGNATALLNQVANIYESIGIELKVTEIFYWETLSPYKGNTREIINQLHDNLMDRTDLSSNVTIFLSGKGNGGRASSLGGICDPVGICYSGQNGDVYTLAHELGHLMSAHHTHACKWNNNYTALDGCGYNAGYGGCPGEDPINGGTLMSYCHIRTVGVNLRFHPQVADVIYDYVSNNHSCSSCEEDGRTPPIDNGNSINANICQVTFVNSNDCDIKVYTMNANNRGNLLTTVKAQNTITSPVIQSVEYGLYDEETLIEKFKATCGSVQTIAACNEQESNGINANICQVTFVNPNDCNIKVYAMNANGRGNLLTTVKAKNTITSPIVQSAEYGIYHEETLIEQFTSTCGNVQSIATCNIEQETGERVLGKVMLEGLYDIREGKMHQNLLHHDLLSKNNPYIQTPWNYQGPSTVQDIPTDAVDWVLIMSRNEDGTVINQGVGFINTTGALIDLKGKQGIPLENANNNYISIHHRGHMAVMSSTSYKVGDMIDFTNSKESVLGVNQLKLIGNTYALHAGDYDANGIINNADYNLWVGNSSKINQYIPADGDGNGVINNKDYNLWISNRSKIGHIPLHY